MPAAYVQGVFRRWLVCVLLQGTRLFNDIWRLRLDWVGKKSSVDTPSIGARKSDEAPVRGSWLCLAKRPLQQQRQLLHLRGYPKTRVSASCKCVKRSLSCRQKGLLFCNPREALARSIQGDHPVDLPVDPTSHRLLTDFCNY